MEKDRNDESILLRFLDEENINAKKAILFANADRLTEGEMNSIRYSLGMEPSDAPPKEQAAEVIRALEMKERYERERRETGGRRYV